MFIIHRGIHLKKNRFIEVGASIGVIILFFILTVVPMTLGNYGKYDEQQIISEKYNFKQYPSFEYYTRYHSSGIPNYVSSNTIEDSRCQQDAKKTIVSDVVQSSDSLDDTLNSSWPMYCHDERHTGQSPYSTVYTTGVEKWRTKLAGLVEGGPVIDKNNVIYVGSNNFYALYPNGTIIWNYWVEGWISTSPAIDENGIIYIGSESAMPNYLYAFYPDGTLKWKYVTSSTGDIHSSPVIGNDGTVYFGDEDANINALYPNGTLRWKYHTLGAVLSSPAIGDDGTIYCGSHDGGLYALDPDTGIVIWRFATGGWVRTAPCIAEDGIIYCVSLDNYLYAVNPNGTMKWKTFVNAGTSPTIGQDGTIYAGWDNLYAINPADGSIKWVFNLGPNRVIEGSTPAHSADGTIYCGVIIRVNDMSQGGEIIAINSNGLEKWRKTIASYEIDSAPAISEDGNIYVGSSWLPNDGYLHAFGPLDSNAPTAPTITGQTSGKIQKTYTYTFTSTSPLGNDIYYTVDWGDGTTTDWLGPYASGETLTLNHSWGSKGTYLIQARAKDTDNLWGPWGSLSVTMPCSYDMPFMNFLEKILERFPHAFPILRYFLEWTETHINIPRLL